MNPTNSGSIDHYLVMRAEACANGANTHKLRGLLGCYFALCELAETNVECRRRLGDAEARLRAFCRAHELQRFTAAGGDDPIWRGDGLASFGAAQAQASE